MLPGPAEIIECPACKSLMQVPSLMSGNTFGAKFYSDGKRVAAMLPDFPKITKCKKCKTIFWVKDATVLGLNEWGNPNHEKWYYAPRVSFLKMEDYQSALELPVNKDKESELIIRKKIWWLFNDRLRKKRPLLKNEAERELWVENLNKLSVLFDETEIEQQILKAEVFRNLGRFDECNKLISAITDTDYTWLKEKYINACEKQNQKLIQLN
jgi:hypothetical protein